MMDVYGHKCMFASSPNKKEPMPHSLIVAVTSAEFYALEFLTRELFASPGLLITMKWGWHVSDLRNFAPHGSQEVSCFVQISVLARSEVLIFPGYYNFLDLSLVSVHWHKKRPLFLLCQELCTLLFSEWQVSLPKLSENFQSFDWN